MWRNTIGRHSKHVCMTCWAFPAFIRASVIIFVIVCKVQLSVYSVICLFVTSAVKIFFFLLFCYNILAISRQNRVRKLINLDIKKEIISKRENVGHLSAECGMAKSMNSTIFKKQGRNKKYTGHKWNL
jgi:hypothetical protein